MDEPRSIIKDSRSDKTKSKQICWGDLEIYEFASILGDNPAATEGSPLTLSWKHQHKELVGIDYHEFLRKNEKKRSRKDLYIPGAERDTYLLSLGYSLNQLLKLSEENENIRKSRQQNMKGRFDSFKKVFSVAIKSSKSDAPKPNIVTSRSG